MEPVLPTTPFRVEFEVISRCNLKCKYCYAMPFTQKMTPLEDLRYLFRKTKNEVDPFEIIILGGEPFLRPDIITVLEDAKMIFGKNVGMSTNGTLLPNLSDAEFDRLRAFSGGLPMIQISLDSSDPQINDALRGGGEMVLKGMSVLDGHNIPFAAGILPTTNNQHDIARTARELLNRFDQLKTINIENLQAVKIMTPSEYRRLLTTGEKREQLWYEVSSIAKELGRLDVKITGLEKEYTSNKTMIDRANFTTCTAGVLRSGVLTDGGVTVCLMVREPIGDLFKESWYDIWSRATRSFRNSRVNVPQCVYQNVLRRETESAISAIPEKQRLRMLA